MEEAENPYLDHLISFSQQPMGWTEKELPSPHFSNEESYKALE